MARVNIELKARDRDPAATLARCLALGAEDCGFLEQRDTYCMERSARLKLREQGKAGSELIAWGRPDSLEPKESTYVLATVVEAGPMAEALEYALGPPVVVVSKRRHLLLWERVRIHLDEVDGLGSFLEFEAVLEPGADAEASAEAHEQLARLRDALGVADEALVSVGY